LESKKKRSGKAAIAFRNRPTRLGHTAGEDIGIDKKDAGFLPDKGLERAVSLLRQVPALHKEVADNLSDPWQG
jgi:hypothetical protein